MQSDDRVEIAAMAFSLIFCVFVFGLCALPTLDRWVIFNYCEGMKLPVEQCLLLLEKK